MVAENHRAPAKLFPGGDDARLTVFIRQRLEPVEGDAHFHPDSLLPCKTNIEFEFTII
jgi:hypothetical protein